LFLFKLITSLSSTGSGLVALGSDALGEPHLHPAALDPPRKLSGEDATLQSIRGRFGGAAAGVSGTSDRIIRRPFDPVDYRLEQIPSSGIGQQALPQALCFSQ
jgi:hypothetical protein